MAVDRCVSFFSTGNINAFAKRLPFTFLIHALFIVLIEAALDWMRRIIRKLAEEKPDLQRALPILDLPVARALALSLLLVPVIYEQARHMIHTIMEPSRSSQPRWSSAVNGT